MNCLIVGYGSIGERHASILEELEHVVHVVTQRNVRDIPCYKTIPEALSTSEFDYVIICNETAKHFESFSRLRAIGYQGKTLIEKPLFHKTPELQGLDVSSTFVAYHLRFHPVILEILRLINAKRILTIHVYVGQYLPDWRPGTCYSKSYSASRKAGGGVLRDLSHELDYVTWFAGRWKRVAAIGSKVSDLCIDSDDVFSLLLETERCASVTMQMTYLDRSPRREIIINVDDGTLKADLFNNTLEINGKISTIEVDRNKPYRDMHRAILTDDLKCPCSFSEGIEIVNLIECAETAAKDRTWVYH